MKKTKRETMIALVVFWGICFLLGIACWILVDWHNWLLILIVAIGIVIGIVILAVSGDRLLTWLLCGLASFILIVVTGSFLGLYLEIEAGIKVNDVIEKYMENRGLSYAPVRGEIKIDNVDARYRLVRTDEGKLVMLWAEVTEKEIGPVREIAIPIVWQPEPIRSAPVTSGLIWMLPESKGMVSEIYLTPSSLRSQEKN